MADKYGQFMPKEDGSWRVVQCEVGGAGATKGATHSKDSDIARFLDSLGEREFRLLPLVDD